MRKPVFVDFRPGATQTRLYSNRRLLDMIGILLINSCMFKLHLPVFIPFKQNNIIF